MWRQRWSVFVFFLIILTPIFHIAVSANQNELIAVEVDEENAAEEATFVKKGSARTEDQPKSTFKATNEWQKIQEDQAIPAGLHVRLNLATGDKEAKLLDDSDKEESKIEEPKPKFTRQQLVDALRSLKDESPKDDKTGQPRERVLKNFRSYEEIKKELSNLNINLRTETEVLIGLLKDYEKAQVKEKIEILHDMEFLVHQYDVAQDLVKLRGLELLLPDLNSTDANLRSQVAFIIGNAAQGNPKVQIAVLEANVLTAMLRLLSLDPSIKVKQKALYAVGSIVRQFPFAQKRFLEAGGLAALASLFNSQKLDSIKLQIKAVTLLNDLIMEQKLTSKFAAKDDEMGQEKLRQYQKLNLEKEIQVQGFCRMIPALLASPDLDVREKVLQAMSSIHEECKADFQETLPTLRSLSQDLKRLEAEERKEENDDETGPSHTDSLSDSYFALLRKMTDNLIEQVSAKSPQKKDEL